MLKIPARFIIIGILIVAIAAWCLVLLIPTRQWVHVGSCALIPAIFVIYAGWLARRSNTAADNVLWIGVLVTMAFLSFASTMAGYAAVP
jgi:hypothetical protein